MSIAERAIDILECHRVDESDCAFHYGQDEALAGIIAEIRKVPSMAVEDVVLLVEAARLPAEDFDFDEHFDRELFEIIGELEALQ